MKLKAPRQLETFEVRPSSEDGEIERFAVKPSSDLPGYDGYLVPFYVLSDRGTFFVPGSLKKTAREQVGKAQVLYQHYPDVIIGRHTSAKEDENGLYVSAAVNEGVTAGAEAMSNLRFGVQMGLSIGFDRISDRSGTPEDDKVLNRKTAPAYMKTIPINELTAITEGRWWEGSLVTWAAIGTAKPAEIRSAFREAEQSTRVDYARLDAILTALKDGQLSDAEKAALTEFVAAFQSHAAAGSDHGTGNSEQARQRQRRADIALAHARHAGLVAQP